ncbi:hypothetical protein EBU99_07615 [bacterium]|nr:hypothetical protein [bacterium]
MQFIQRFIPSFLLLGLAACGHKNVDSSSVDSIYKLPATDNDTDANMVAVQLNDVSKDGVIKCEGFDKKRNYIYSRLEFKNSQVTLAYVGAVQGKYELFHHDIAKKILNLKYSFEDEKGLVNIYAAQAGQPRKIYSLALKLADTPKDAELPEEIFYAAQLAYMDPTTNLDLSSVRMTCDVFRLKK